MTQATKLPSASGLWTGPIGLVAAIGALALLHGLDVPSHAKTVLLVLAIVATMAAVETILYGALRKTRQITVPQPANWPRIGQKLVGLYATFAVLGALYWLLPLYADTYYQPFVEACLLVLPALLVFSPVYVWFVDGRMAEPNDAYVQVAQLIGGTWPSDWSVLIAHAKGWLVKAFFLPLMFVFLNSDLGAIWTMTELPSLTTLEAVYSHSYDTLYLIDVLFACSGYVMTLRLFGTQIKSAEPTLLGWGVCLACYPPFWSTTATYLSYDQDNVYWGRLFSGSPLLYGAWGTLILLFVVIYVWATISFGMRFSNLTNRGIITHGPYRWVKHPAYLTKNITWWLISVPFVAGTGDWGMALRSSVLLAGVNVVYFLRARTEERHLAADPAYRQYTDFIAEHGLWAIISRSISRRRQAPAALAANTGK